MAGQVTTALSPAFLSKEKQRSYYYTTCLDLETLLLKWSAHPAPNEGLVIQIPAHLFPSRSLSYREPELGEKIILGPVSDFPTREWRIDAALQKPIPVLFFIRVPDTDLIVFVPKLTIFPPQLALQTASLNLESAWALIPVGED